MSRATCLALVALCLLAAGCRGAAAPESAAPGATFALVGVDVVPLDRETVLTDQTVVVADGRVVALGAAGEVAVPRGASRIDGRGRWLMPGLTDLHVHQERPEELLFFLANGVTTVLNLSGSPEHLELRSRLARGAELGPRLFTSGPIVVGDDLDADNAVRRVEEVAAAGYDCMKIYANWTEEAFLAVADACERLGLPLMGHAPRNLPLTTVLRDGREQIVHLEELVYTTPELQTWLDRYRAGEPPRPEDAPGRALAEPVRRLARGVVASGLWVIPTEIVIDNYALRATPEGRARLAARPYLRYLDPVLRRMWEAADQSHRRIRNEQQMELQHFMLEIFREEGVPLAVGTDAGVEQDLNVMPGWSLHEELAILTGLGFTPYEALRQATVAAAAFLGLPGEGIVAEGARADLLLLDANPLEDPGAARRPAAVVAGGRWLGRAELEQRLSEVEEGFVPLERQIARFDAALESRDMAAVIAELGRIEQPLPGVAAFAEQAVNREGYRLLGADRLDESIAVFELNVEAFPEAANPYDSLAEAWLAKGDRERAIALYRQALEVDPEFRNAARMLARLEAGS